MKRQQDLEKGHWALHPGRLAPEVLYLWEGLEGKTMCAFVHGGLLLKSPHKLEFPSGLA